MRRRRNVKSYTEQINDILKDWTRRDGEYALLFDIEYVDGLLVDWYQRADLNFLDYVPESVYYCKDGMKLMQLGNFKKTKRTDHIAYTTLGLSDDLNYRMLLLRKRYTKTNNAKYKRELSKMIEHYNGILTNTIPKYEDVKDKLYRKTSIHCIQSNYICLEAGPNYEKFVTDYIETRIMNKYGMNIDTFNRYREEYKEMLEIVR